MQPIENKGIKRPIRAVEALEEAQKIAFAPFVFQATVSLRNLGIFEFIFNNRDSHGTTITEISDGLSLSAYGIGVLLEIAESSNIVAKDEFGRYELTKIGYFLSYNTTANANINFTQDVCYKGLFHMEEAIRTGKPSGLKELGNWATIYEGLSQLDPHVQKAWFDFDHHYSDDIFAEAMDLVFQTRPNSILDIGGNTGKFAIQCCKRDAKISIQILDLPGQLNKALKNAKISGFENRVKGREIDWLSKNPEIPPGADLIWMCQFLDCFSEDEIIKILSTCVASMNESTEIRITETFTDRQKFENAKFILEATSLYFTVMANGNSKMYSSEVLMRLIDTAGLKITEDISLGEYHTMLVCKKK
jgi:Dimerisation2-like domain/O-methyltransferase domain